jgi:RNA-directed DNA polymerase
MESEKSAEVVVKVRRLTRRTESNKQGVSLSLIDGCAAPESREKSQSHGVSGSKAELESAAHEEGQRASAAWEQQRALTTHLMERVCGRANLNQAYKRVKANRGSPGIDGMNIEQLGAWIRIHKEELIGSLLDGSYQPQPVRGVQIPKHGGGMRQLGIPTVVDRLVQQAILQVLQPIFDPTFSDSSYGFRPGRSAHHALSAARGYVREGNLIVVDVDLEKFFDRVNHDILMSRLARRIGDKRLLKILRRFLQAGMMSQGVNTDRHEGTPQGGPLSPLLANLLLDELDQELEKRGHKFCRYADDCNIYVKTKSAGERVMNSVTQFLELRLKLKVNREKSAVAWTWERKFLGHRLLSGGRLGIAPKSLKAAKDRIRQLTRRNRGESLEKVIHELNRFLLGWVAYYRFAAIRSHLADLDHWIERKLRCYRLKQCKRPYSIVKFLRRLGVPEGRAWILGKAGKGWWRLSKSPPIHEAMDVKWFRQAGLVNLVQRYTELQT